MRAPKYRAWHTKSGRFAKDGELFLIIDSKNYNLYSVDFDNFRLENDNYILMQSTGLKDKYGIEMFEGDIVKHHNDILSTVFYSTSHCAYLLQDINGNRNKCQFDKLGNYSSLWIEVIGNIYENPKLLEVEDES